MLLALKLSTILYMVASGNWILLSTAVLMSATTSLSALPVVLAEMTILRWVFSRLMVLGPALDMMSATSDRGTLRPSCVS